MKYVCNERKQISFSFNLQYMHEMDESSFCITTVNNIQQHFDDNTIKQQHVDPYIWTNLFVTIIKTNAQNCMYNSNAGSIATSQ